MSNYTTTGQSPGTMTRRWVDAATAAMMSSAMMLMTVY